jgi:hypothetical protein
LVEVECRVNNDNLMDMRDSSLRESNGRSNWRGDSTSKNDIAEKYPDITAHRAVTRNWYCTMRLVAAEQCL